MTPTATVRTPNLSVEAWAEAALDAIASGGLDAVAVEPLARQLGVTKGSFYWHFTNREALIKAALERWEQHQSGGPIERAELLPNPRDRLHALLREVANTDSRSERVLLILVASDHELARSCEKRVSARWRAYVGSCYQALGYSESEARQRASIAYATFVGNVLLRRDNPAALPVGDEFHDYLRLTIRSLIPAVTPSESAASAARANEARGSVIPLSAEVLS